MADFYCDTSALGNEYQAYAATPTWGALSTDKPLPMDGNGKAGPGHAAEVAIAEIIINALPADGNTLVIAGATVTAKTSATLKNQWTLGASVATCVTNLVALFNTFGTGAAQCDAAVNSGSSALLLALPYWQFARVKPGTTNTLQIATRIAGSNLNHAANSNVAISSSGWGTAPTITQFAGGADGPWAYLLTGDVVFGKGALQYGLWFAIASSPSGPNANDVVHVRTKRGGVDLAAGISWTGVSLSAGWKTTTYLYDDGTVWSDGSSSNGQLTVSITSADTGSGRTFSASVGGVVHESRASYNLKVLVSSGHVGSTITLFNTSASNAYAAFRRCLLEVAVGSANAIVRIADVSANNSWTGCLFDFTDSKFKTYGSTRTFLNFSQNGVGYNTAIFNGAEFEVVAATVNIGGMFSVGGSSQTGLLQWVGGRVYDSNGVYPCINPVTLSTSQTAFTIVIDSVVGITSQEAAWGQSRIQKNSMLWNAPEGANKAFLYSTSMYSVDWKGDGTFPYCGSASDLRGVNWSHRITWTGMPSMFCSATPVTLRYFHRAATAARTITCELYTPDSAIIYKDGIAIEVSYIDSGGVLRTEVTSGAAAEQFGAVRAALSSSSATWTTSGVSSYSAKKLELTTSYPVKQDSEITAVLMLRAPQASNIVIYASPELGVV